MRGRWEKDRLEKRGQLTLQLVAMKINGIGPFIFSESMDLASYVSKVQLNGRNSL